MGSTDNSAIMTIDLKWNRFRIHKSTLNKMGNPQYVQFLVNPEEMFIAVLGSDRPLTGGTSNRVKLDVYKRQAHESEFMTLSQETELLKQRIAAIQESTVKDNGEQSRLEQIQAIISERENKCMEYDDSIVRQMVECIKAYPGGKLEIIFGGGYLVEESV